MFIGSSPIQKGGSPIHQPIGGGLTAGVYLNGNYVNKTDTVTENSSYTVEYYEVDSDLVRHPASGYSTQVESLSLGSNAYSIISAYGNDPVNGTLYLADTFTITTTGGTAIGTIPEIESTISGGAWSITAPDALVPSYATQNTISEGDNTVTMQYSDANGDVFTSDNTIEVTYAGTAPIVEIDGQDVSGTVVTDKSSVTVTYLYGGSLVVDLGEQVLDLGEIVYYGGVLVDVNNYPLDLGINQVQVIGETDDFGNLFNTNTEVAERIEGPEGPDFSENLDGIVGQLGQNQYNGTFDDNLDGIVGQLGELV